MFRMGNVRVEIVHERLNAVSQNIRQRFLVGAGHGIAEHCAFAKSATADDDFVETDVIDNFLNDGKRGRENIGASRRQPFDFWVRSRSSVLMVL